MVSLIAVAALVVLLVLVARPDPTPTESDTDPTVTREPVPSPSPPGPPEPPSTEPTPTPSTEPTSGTDAAALVDNPIYPEPIPASTCTDVAAAPTDPAGLQSYGDQWVDCLSQAWEPLLTNTAGSFEAPDFVVFPSESVTTACGTAGGAFYCPADHSIYIGADFIADYVTAIDTMGLGVSYFYVVTHEYHHHVQNSAGMLDALVAQYQTNYPEGSRRLELQDQCWVSMALRTTPGYDFTADRQQIWLELLSHSTSTRHGDSTSTVHWGGVGLTAETLGDCNSWVAPAEDVS